MDKIKMLREFKNRLDEFAEAIGSEIHDYTLGEDSISLSYYEWEGHCSSCTEQVSHSMEIPYSIFFSEILAEDHLTGTTKSQREEKAKERQRQETERHARERARTEAIEKSRFEELRKKFEK